MSLFRLGQITSPVGIKGEVRVYPYLDITRFSDIESLFIEGDNTSHQIEKFRIDKNTIVLKLSGIDDRNMSEALRSKYLVVPKEQIDMPEGTYFTEDLLGMHVYDDKNAFLGILESVDQNSPQDKYVINTGNKTFMLPAVEEFILDVDVDNKKMIVHLVDGILDL